jgi:hypothetical protein
MGLLFSNQGATHAQHFLGEEQDFEFVCSDERVQSTTAYGEATAAGRSSEFLEHQ